MERHSKIRYGVSDVLQFVVEPGAESGLSDLEESDEDERLPDEVLPNEFLHQETNLDEILDEEELAVDEDDDELVPEDDEQIPEDDNEQVPEDNDQLTEESENREPERRPRNQNRKKTKKPKQPGHEFNWKKTRPPAVDTIFRGDQFNLPPDDADTLTPLQYFKMFWGDELTSLLAEQTNIYSVQKSGKSIDTTSREIEQLLGMQMFMSIINFPIICNVLGCWNSISTCCRHHANKPVQEIETVFTRKQQHFG